MPCRHGLPLVCFNSPIVEHWPTYTKHPISSPIPLWNWASNPNMFYFTHHWTLNPLLQTPPYLPHSYTELSNFCNIWIATNGLWLNEKYMRIPPPLSSKVFTHQPIYHKGMETFLRNHVLEPLGMWWEACYYISKGNPNQSTFGQINLVNKYPTGYNGSF